MLILVGRGPRDRESVAAYATRAYVLMPASLFLFNNVLSLPCTLTPPFLSLCAEILEGEIDDMAREFYFKNPTPPYCEGERENVGSKRR